MEHKFGAKKDAEILHEIKKKTELSKKNIRGINNEKPRLQMSEKRYKIAEGKNTVKKGGVTYGKPPPAVKREKLKYRINKGKSGDKPTKFEKAAGGVKKGAAAIGSVVVDPAVKAGGAVVSAVEKAAGGEKNEAVEIAKKTASASKTAAATAARATKKTAKAVYTVGTKRGRRKVVKKVKKKITRVKKTVKRTAKTVKQTAKLVARAAKFAAKTAAKAAKLVAKVVAKIIQFIASTAPYSLIILAVIAILVLACYLISAAISDEENKVVAGAMNPDEEMEDAAINLRNYEKYLGELLEDNILIPLKEMAAEFCGETDDETSDDSSSADEDEETSEGSDTSDDNGEETESGSIKRIFEINGKMFFPADENTDEINAAINTAAGMLLTEEKIDKFLGLVKVFKAREWYSDDHSDNAGELENYNFKKADFEELFGKLNVNSGKCGDTFLIKSYEITDDHECPDENCCYHENEDECPEWIEDNDSNSGHCSGYCPKIHKKMTVTLMTVDEYLEKTVDEIYGFDEDDEYYFDGFLDTLAEIRAFINREDENVDNSGVPYEIVDIPFIKHTTPKFEIGKVELGLLIVIGVGTLFMMIFKRRS